MSKLYKINIIFYILLLNFFYGLAQQSQYSFRRIDISNGLSHNQINTIFEDSRGFMWFGTISGLNRYDGHSFKIFRNDPKDPFTLKDNYVTKICELPDNNLWVKSVEGNNCIYDITKDKFLADQSSFFKKYNLPLFALINVINKNSVFWFLYPGKGIYKLSPDKAVEPILIGNKNDQSADSSVTDIQFDSKNNIWAIHQNGIIEKIDAVTNKVIFRSTAFQSAIIGKQINAFSLFIDNSDELW
ncbi:MAG: hybrid sensor histidine kinase/response regulator, partial [Bacteroidota bacterium]|nr:hybrid sensor histidine kinase/response regulator [Bacteroidota bacterium]